MINNDDNILEAFSVFNSWHFLLIMNRSL